MDASTLRHAAGSVGERVSDVAHTVAEKAPDVTHKVGDTAHRLAAKTPWVEEPQPPSHGLQRWVVRLAVLATVAAVAWWFATRRGHEPAVDDVDSTKARRDTDQRRFAAVGT